MDKMEGDPAQFFTRRHAEQVRREVAEHLEVLLRPTFGERWREVAASKSSAETVRKLARAKTEDEQAELLKLIEAQFPLEPIKLPKTG